MIAVRFHTAARAEFEAAAEYYEPRRNLLGDDFLEEVANSLRKISDWPEAYAALNTEFRGYHLSRFPYTIIYRSRAQELFIIAVAHQSRKPDYWKPRASTSD